MKMDDRIELGGLETWKMGKWTLSGTREGNILTSFPHFCDSIIYIILNTLQ